MSDEVPSVKGFKDLMKDVMKHPDKVLIIVDLGDSISFASGEGIDLDRSIYLLDRAKHKIQQRLDG